MDGLRRVRARGGCSPGAFEREVRRVAVRDVHVLRRDVDVREEASVHEGVIGLRVGGGDADVFVLDGERSLRSWDLVTLEKGDGVAEKVKASRKKGAAVGKKGSFRLPC